MTNQNLLDFLKSDLWKEYEKSILKKEKYIRQGTNVVHLEYTSEVLTESDISRIEEKVEIVGFELSRYDRKGDIIAFFDKYDLGIFLLISQPLISDLIKGISTNAAWDMIKSIILSTLKKVNKKSKTNDLTFGIKFSLDKNTRFNFKLEGDLNDEIIKSSLDQALEFLKNENLNQNYKLPDFVHYDAKQKKWMKTEVEKDLQEMIKTKRKK